MTDIKRLFFGLEVLAPWSDHLPKARIVAPEFRHITLAFLGSQSFSELERILPHLPAPLLNIGTAAQLSHTLFLSNVVSYGVKWYTHYNRVEALKESLDHWLKSEGYSVDERPFLPHVTMGREPFDKKEWEENFTPLPMITKSVHLYESSGNLHYQSLWEYPILPPFEEMEHTADIAFRIRGEDLNEIYLNAATALAFHCPALVRYITPLALESLDDVIIELNRLIARVDVIEGVPFKAVSFHGSLQEVDDFKVWEMIVDV